MLDESIEEFDTFAQAIRDDLRPRGPMENVLVDRIIHISWKLRRIPRLEGEMLVEPEPSIAYDLDERQSERIAYVMKMDLRMEGSAMRKVQEYELRLDRALHATLRELKRLRAMNREGAADAQPLEEPDAQRVEAAYVAIPQNEPVLPALAELTRSDSLSLPARSDPAPSAEAPPRARAS